MVLYRYVWRSTHLMATGALYFFSFWLHAIKPALKKEMLRGQRSQVMIQCCLVLDALSTRSLCNLYFFVKFNKLYFEASYIPSPLLPAYLNRAFFVCAALASLRYNSLCCDDTKNTMHYRENKPLFKLIVHGAQQRAADLTFAYYCSNRAYEYYKPMAYHGPTYCTAKYKFTKLPPPPDEYLYSYVKHSRRIK